MLCLLACLLVLAGLTVDAQTFLLARLIFLLLSKDDRVSATTTQPQRAYKTTSYDHGGSLPRVRYERRQGAWRLVCFGLWMLCPS